MAKKRKTSKVRRPKYAKLNALVEIRRLKDETQDQIEVLQEMVEDLRKEINGIRMSLPKPYVPAVPHIPMWPETPNPWITFNGPLSAGRHQ